MDIMIWQSRKQVNNGFLQTIDRNLEPEEKLACREHLLPTLFTTMHLICNTARHQEHHTKGARR